MAREFLSKLLLLDRKYRLLHGIIGVFVKDFIITWTLEENSSLVRINYNVIYLSLESSIALI